MRRALAGFAPLALLALAHCGIDTWPNVAANGTKPPSPLAAPRDKALLVLVKNNNIHYSMGSGDGTTTVTVMREDGTVVAQFPDDQPPGWSVLPLEPGKHAFYLRTFSSKTCWKISGDFAQGKIYVYGLVYDPPPRAGGMLSPERNRWLDAKKDDPAGPLGFHRYVALDEGAARAMMAERRGAASECIANAEAREAHVAGPSQAFESIDFGH